jgi:phosphatidylglycerol---prolipoprotein diacylglyceryl transferase
MPDYYVHDLSPHILKFTDSLALHWYGLAYVLGFYLCYLVVLSLSRRGLCEVQPAAVADFITYTAIFGVVLGGRLGYMLLYSWESFSREPWNLLLIFQGGMSSHGGIAGVALFLLWYARKYKISWTGLGDALVAGAPLGILTGRLANFINGELFGRATDVSWAVRFPTEIHHLDFQTRYYQQHGADFPYLSYPQHSHEILAKVGAESGGDTGAFEQLLTPRHPSQLYEALGEGLLLCAVLYFLRVRFPRLRTGIITGIFFVLYALIRIALEEFREPDSGAEMIMGLTRGQFFSTFMVVIGVAFILWGARWGKVLQRGGSNLAESGTNA